jgi:hypothetical protein
VWLLQLEYDRRLERHELFHADLDAICPYTFGFHSG